MNTPTPTPALTDEQIHEIVTQALAEGNPWRAANAVANAMRDLIARAKRDERERIAAALEASAIGLGDRDSLNNSERALRNGLMLGAQLALQEATQ